MADTTTEVPAAQSAPPRPAVPSATPGATPGATLGATPGAYVAAQSTRLQRAALLAGLGVAVWLGLQLFASILLPFVAAAVIAYFLHPLATRLARAGLPRALASALLLVGLVAAGLLFVLLLYPLILQQAGLLLGRVPGYVEALRVLAEGEIGRLQQRLGPDYVDARLRELVGGQIGSVLSFLAGALTRIVGGGFALFNVLSLLVVTPVVAFYFLRDWPRILAGVDGWLPRRNTAVLRALAREVDRILSAWLRGQALCCVVLALFYAAALSAAGLDLGLIVGLATGVLSFIPYVGSICGGLASIGLAAAQFPGWGGVARVAGVYALGQILENYVIYPRFLGGRVELHAVWVIFALFAGGAGFGFLGVLLAVPAAAALGVVTRYWLRRYLASPLYLDPPQ